MLIYACTLHVHLKTSIYVSCFCNRHVKLFLGLCLVHRYHYECGNGFMIWNKCIITCSNSSQICKCSLLQRVSVSSSKMYYVVNLFHRFKDALSTFLITVISASEILFFYAKDRSSPIITHQAGAYTTELRLLPLIEFNLRFIRMFIEC